MKTYLLTSKVIKGEGVFFAYNESNQLIRFDASDNVSSAQIKWLHDNMPLNHDMLPSFKKRIESNKDNKATIVQVQTDLSFNVFWTEYAHKVGKKSRAQKQWDGMTDSSKIQALEHIKKYNYRLSQGNIEKQYPTTFLSNREWEN